MVTGGQATAPPCGHYGSVVRVASDRWRSLSILIVVPSSWWSLFHGPGRELWALCHCGPCGDPEWWPLHRHHPVSRRRRQLVRLQRLRGYGKSAVCSADTGYRLIFISVSVLLMWFNSNPFTFYRKTTLIQKGMCRLFLNTFQLLRLEVPNSLCCCVPVDDETLFWTSSYRSHNGYLLFYRKTPSTFRNNTYKPMKYTLDKSIPCHLPLLLILLPLPLLLQWVILLRTSTTGRLWTRSSRRPIRTMLTASALHPPPLGQ